MRSSGTHLQLSPGRSGFLRMNGGIVLTAAVLILVCAAVFVYLYAPPFVSAFHKSWQSQGEPSASSLKAEESVIKEVLIEYVHSMLLDGSKVRHELFTEQFLDAGGADDTAIPKVNSAQIGQPVIAFSSPELARVRFPQIVRMQAGVRLSQERFLFKRTGGGRWKIDQRASQPVMASSSNEVFDKNAFLYVKSENEKARDRRDIEGLIASWTDARSNADVDGVLNAYRKDIWKRKGTTKEEWMETFRNRKKISVSNVNIVYPQQLRAEVTLNERIDESHKQTHFDRRLILELSDLGWLITDEESRTLSEQIVQPIQIVPKLASMADGDTMSKIDSLSQTNNAVVVSPEPRTVKNAVAHGVPTELTTDVVKVAVSKADETNDIKEFVHKWATAWSKKDVQEYLSFYSQKFLPVDGVSFAQWRKHRTTRIVKPSFIEVKVRELQVKRHGQDRAKVSFIQFYRSDTYQDKALKTLTLARESGEWKIAGEYSTNL